MCLTAKLSQKSCVALFCSTFSSFRSHRSQRISLTVDAMARYSASAEERDTTVCFFDFHDTGDPPKRSK
ncbi:hypothetical protein HanXRQr2_Chr05g0193371 [Helianthus annuus]|uniref:Uncharacterized protein n=1 Tax=Helianthus annuus TaxID=4232 RepID=A0A9K3NLI7_HELAN|nr:hypothetical protein HanXRQr2_Chr05g0193371 [Helianthus annuus]